MPKWEREGGNTTFLPFLATFNKMIFTTGENPHRHFFQHSRGLFTVDKMIIDTKSLPGRSRGVSSLPPTRRILRWPRGRGRDIEENLLRAADNLWQLQPSPKEPLKDGIHTKWVTKTLWEVEG